jgi:membrane associated rhomboid family serine protease
LSEGDNRRAAVPDPWATPPRVHEPAFRLAWPTGVVVAVLILVFIAQILAGGADVTGNAFGFAPVSLTQGGWWTVFTAMFVHGGWAHVLVNSAFCIAFGQPVARRFGLSLIGGAIFLLFFILCGLAGNLGYALIHPNGGQPVVGASGAIAGLYAGASRLIRGGPGVAPLTSPPVVVMGAAWITINLVIAFLHVDAGFGTGGAPVAWEAHIAGYLAGLLLMGLFVRAAPGPGFQR